MKQVLRYWVGAGEATSGTGCGWSALPHSRSLLYLAFGAACNWPHRDWPKRKQKAALFASTILQLSARLPHDSRIPHVFFLGKRINLFLFCFVIQGKFSAMLFDRFICLTRSVSQFWLLEDGWSCVTRRIYFSSTGQMYHTWTFTWKASGSRDLSHENMTGWAVKKHCSSWRRQVLRCERLWNQIWFGGCFQKHEQHGRVSKFHVPLQPWNPLTF